MIEIYTDGSSLGNPGAAGWGVIVVENGRVVKKMAGGKTVATNNEMELVALLYAMRWVAQAQRSNPVPIFTDSSYSLRSIVEWAPSWEKNGWVNSKRQPVANKAIIQQCLSLYRQLGTNQVELKKIKAHAGHKYNEMADQLAVEYARMRKS